jgi:uncharacterized protein (DUF885 family)
MGKSVNVHRSQVPWWMVRNRCVVCTGFHAPWWRHGQAPSCVRDNPKTNDVVMFLESLRALETPKAVGS